MWVMCEKKTINGIIQQWNLTYVLMLSVQMRLCMAIAIKVIINSVQSSALKKKLFIQYFHVAFNSNVNMEYSW